MKRKLTLILIVVLCAVCLLACACNGGANGIAKAQKDAIQTLSSLECLATVNDGETVVYKYKKLLLAQENELYVSTTESKLGSSFVLEDKTTAVDMELDRSLIKAVNISSKIVSETTTDGNTTVCKVAKENVSVLLGADVNAASDATVTAVMNDKLEEITVEFSTNSGKSVTINYKFGY